MGPGAIGVGRRRLHFLRSCLTLALVLGGAPRSPLAEESDATAPTLEDRWVVYADAVGLIGPLGVAAFTGVAYRHPYDYSEEFETVWSQFQLWAHLGVNPAYAQLSAYAEWMPLLPVQLVLGYDYFGYFGAWGALLSFDSPGAHFGDEVLEQREGEEQLGNGHRVVFRPVLRGMVGPLVIRNQTDLAYHHLVGDGPYFFEWEYDTLVAEDDLVVLNRTELLLMAWSGGVDATFLVGPYYEVTHTAGTDNRRQRVGFELFWIPADNLGAFGQLRFYSQVGANLEDRNRENEFYLIIGFGSDWTISPR